MVVETPGLLTSGDHKHFRISWNNGVVRVVSEGRLLMEWRDLAPFGVSHFGVRTAWGATGLWSINVLNDVDGLGDVF